MRYVVFAFPIQKVSCIKLSIFDWNIVSSSVIESHGFLRDDVFDLGGVCSGAVRYSAPNKIQAG